MTLDTLKERCASQSYPICFNDFRVALIDLFGPEWWEYNTQAILAGSEPHNCPDWLIKELNGRLRRDDMTSLRVLLVNIDKKLDRLLYGH